MGDHNNTEYSFFSCKKCKSHYVKILRIKAGAGGASKIVVVCGGFKADGTGCQTDFPELKVTANYAKNAPKGE